MASDRKLTDRGHLKCARWARQYSINVSSSVVESAFNVVNINIKWEGKGVDEIGRCSEKGDVLVKINPKYFRPAEVEVLLGDSSKAKKILGWSPKVNFDELVKMMVESDLKRIK